MSSLWTFPPRAEGDYLALKASERIVYNATFIRLA